MATTSGLAVPPVKNMRADRRPDSERARDLFCVAAFAALSLIYNIVAWAKADTHPARFLFFDYVIAAVAIALGFLASQSIKRALFVLPVTAVLMTAPELAHLPFLREFGSFAAVGVALRLATHGPMSLARIPRQAAAAAGLPTVILFAAYVLISLVPMALHLRHGQSFEAKVVGAEMIYECGAVSVVVAIVIAVNCLDEAALEALYQGILAASIEIIVLSILALFLPLAINEPLKNVDYFGLYYYCRMRMTAFGPDEYCAFLVMVAPALLLVKALYPGSRKARIAILCLYVLPLLLVAGNSRSARIGLVVAYAIALTIPDFRRTVIGPAIFSILLFLATLNYRCISDYFLAYQNVPLQGGYIAINSFFADPIRLHLLEHVVHQAGTDSDIYLVFGHGAGLAAFDQFGLGGHSSLLDLFVDKGAIGCAIVVAAVSITIWRIARSWTLLSHKLRLYAYTALIMITPLVTSGATYDARRWLFAWMTIGILLGTAALTAHKRPPTEQLARIG
jgi:hypothetical protein